MPKKIEVHTEIFGRLWEEMTDKLIELKPEFRHAIDFDQNKTGSCEILAQVLNKERCKGNTIYKEYFTPYQQAKRLNKPTFLIGPHFLEWLTELVHGEGHTFETHYLSKPQKGKNVDQIAQQLMNSYALGIEQQQAFWNILKKEEIEERNQNLAGWLSKHIWLKRLLGLGGIMVGISLAGILGLGIFEQEISVEQGRIIQSMQFIWILLAAGFVFQYATPSQHLDSPNLARASNGQNRLLSYWLRLWGAWFLLYACWFVQGFMELTTFQNMWFNLGVNAINLGTALYLYLMYLEMSKETVQEERHLHISFKYYVFLLAYIGVEAVFRNLFPELSGLFSILSGILTAIATFLFVSRLNSKILDVPPLFIHLLVAYAAIQPMIPYIIEPGMTNLSQESVTIFATLLTTLAFAAKIILLCVITWLHSSFRLLHYMLRIYHVHKNEHLMRDMALKYLEKK